MLMSHLRVINPVLTNMSIAARQSKEGFVADAILPDVPVSGDTGTIPVWEISNAARVKTSRWGKGGVAPQVELRAGSTTFYCKKFGLSIPVEDDDRQNYLMPGSLDEEVTNTLTDLLMLDREKRVYDMINALTADATLTTTQWNDTSGVNPKKDIQDGAMTIMKKTMKLPNLFVIGQDVWSDVKSNITTGTAGKQFADAFVQVLAATGGNLTIARFAEFLGVDRVLVANALHEATDEENTTVNLTGLTSGAFVWGDIGLLLYTEPTPQIGSISFGKSFTSWPMSILPTYRKDEVEADIYRIKAKWDEKVVARPCGYLIKDILQ